MSHQSYDRFKKIFLVFVAVLFSNLIINCEKEIIETSYHKPPEQNQNPEEPEDNKEPKPEEEQSAVTDSISVTMSHEDSVAISKLPLYYNFLKGMKSSGFSFIDFRTYLSSDTTLLPDKLLVIRHDVHIRDINWAYYSYQIERLVIGPRQSTFFIMLNDPYELDYYSTKIQEQYLDLIHYLDNYGVDIQPHISPVDMYVMNVRPEWESYPVDTLKGLFLRNYQWQINNDGRELIVTGEDVLNLEHFNNYLLNLLAEYNRGWTEQTSLQVQGYASHGSSSVINKVLNNAVVLDQYVLLFAGIYEYDTYNSRIFNALSYLSDNYLPPWMSDPASIPPGRYQFLMHPYQWSRR